MAGVWHRLPEWWLYMCIQLMLYMAAIWQEHREYISTTDMSAVAA